MVILGFFIQTGAARNGRQTERIGFLLALGGLGVGGKGSRSVGKLFVAGAQTVVDLRAQARFRSGGERLFQVHDRPVRLTRQIVDITQLEGDLRRTLVIGITLAVAGEFDGGFGIAAHQSPAQGQVVQGSLGHVALGITLENIREIHGRPEEFLLGEIDHTEAEQHRYAQFTLTEEGKKLLEGLLSLGLVVGHGVGIAHQELGPVGGRKAGELTNDPPERVRGIHVLFLFVLLLGDLELGISRERTGGVQLDQLGQLFHAAVLLSQAVQGHLDAPDRFGAHGAAGIAVDHFGISGQRVRIPACVVVALGDPQQSEGGGGAATEIFEQTAIAPLGLGVLFGLEIQVAGPGPGFFGDFQVRIQPDDGFPAIDRVAGPVQAQVTQARLVKGQILVLVGRIADQELLVGVTGLRILPLVETHVGNVEEGIGQLAGVAAVRPTGEHLLGSADGEILFTLLGVGPGQQLLGRRRSRVLGKFAEQAFETLARFLVLTLGGQGVSIDQQGIGPPGRLAGRCFLQHQMRCAGQLPQIPGPMIGQFQQAQGGLDQLLMAR